MKTAIGGSASREILAVLQKHEVPLQYGVALLCKWQGVTLHSLAEDIGLHRNFLYKSLAGERAPNPELLGYVEQVLGVNPWEFSIAKRRVPGGFNRG